MTQADLGREADVLRSSVANIESGRQKPPLHVLYRLCAELNLEVSDVLLPVSEIVTEVQIVDHSVGSDKLPPRAAEYLKSVREEGYGTEPN
jgi:DNA-binding XRE family transcriptional regulator